MSRVDKIIEDLSLGERHLLRERLNYMVSPEGAMLSGPRMVGGERNAGDSAKVEVNYTNTDARQRLTDRIHRLRHKADQLEAFLHSLPGRLTPDSEQGLNILMHEKE